MTGSHVHVMQEVLNSVAVVSKAGPNKDLWELKKEYRGGRNAVGGDSQ